ncbi:MAG TPA: glutamate--cysteine ligase [Jatrophihabitans sp.]|nr:glutamate--cysteine ligase [Jatrophihabitans sp.]
MRKFGVEEELLLVDAADLRPAPVGAAVSATETTPLEHEFKQEQVEIGSSPQLETAELREELVRLRAEADQAAKARGASVVAIATSPWKLSPRVTPDQRYHRMVAEFGLLAREQLTCGQHVHVEVASRAEGVAVLDRIRGWLPALLALSANSPYWQGQDTGYASFRNVLWGRWPTAGPTDLFGDEAGYDNRIASLIEAGAALDDGMIYFDARLSARYPTVEIRVADVCTDVDDAVLVAALARGLVDTAAAQWRAGQPASPISTPVLRAASWRAARWGLDSSLIAPDTRRPAPAWAVIDQLLDWTAESLRRHGDADLVAAGVNRIRSGGGGAARQRAAFTRFEQWYAVVADAARRTVAG